MASGRVNIDLGRGRAHCLRCGEVFESSTLAALLSFAQQHHACPGAAQPVVLVSPPSRVKP